MALTRGSRRLFDWLQEQQAGTIVTRAEVMRVAQWSPVSLKTYLDKNKLAPFLQPLAGHDLKVLLNGAEISEQFFDETFTQTAPRPLTLSAGDTLVGNHDTYDLLAPIGNGAVGKVWSARPTGSTNSVAAKIMLPREDLLQNSKLPDVRERFRREASYGRGLQHTNLVQYLDTGQLNKNPFLVMELANRSVADKIIQSGTVPEEEAAEIIQCCVAGLRFLHLHGHSHRDVKPANILEFPSTFKLGDLGIVRWSDFDPAITGGGTITRLSLQLGSWFYMAPEQQQSPHDVTYACDIYALGVTWIEMLTATIPAPHAIGAKAYHLPTLRDGVADLVRRMCSYAPSQRPSLDDIDAVLLPAYGP